MRKKNCLCLKRISWALGQATGRQFITALVSTYILIFMTDAFGVPAAAAGVIMTAATVWDAMNDPIMGRTGRPYKEPLGYLPSVSVTDSAAIIHRIRSVVCSTGSEHYRKNCLRSGTLYLLWNACNSHRDSILCNPSNDVQK